MSVNRKTLVIVAILLIILVSAGLIIYSITGAADYEGIFVNGVKQVCL